MSGWRCPCGARAWSRAELQALCRKHDDEGMAAYWESVMGPEDFYCANEDDVLLPGQAVAA